MAVTNAVPIESSPEEGKKSSRLNNKVQFKVVRCLFVLSFAHEARKLVSVGAVSILGNLTIFSIELTLDAIKCKQIRIFTYIVGPMSVGFRWERGTIKLNLYGNAIHSFMSVLRLP